MTAEQRTALKPGDLLYKVVLRYQSHRLFKGVVVALPSNGNLAVLHHDSHWIADPDFNGEWHTTPEAAVKPVLAKIESEFDRARIELLSLLSKAGSP